MELSSTRAFPVHGMDGEFIRVDGELFGGWPWYVPPETFDRWFKLLRSGLDIVWRGASNFKPDYGQHRLSCYHPFENQGDAFAYLRG